jgi:two-component SAPR family response regulator
VAGARTARGGVVPDATADVTAARLEAAVELYRGPLLDGFEAEWAAVARAEAERQFLAAAQALLSIYCQRANHHAAIALAERVLAQDPFQDDFHVAILHHQLALGQSAAARRHFQEYARVMRAELGHEPSPKARVLMASLGS